MSKVVVTLYAVCLLGFSGCAKDDADDGNTAGSGGAITAGSGGAIAGSGGAITAGSGGMNAGSGGATAGSGGMSAGSGGMPDGMGGSGGMIASGPPTFARVWTEVLVKKSCNSSFCHGIGMGSLSMRNKDDAYMNLVEVAAAGPACGTSGLVRVKRSAPEQSLLLDKISHPMPACGDPMPIGTRFPPNCLSDSAMVCNMDAEITLVRDWIAAGANND